MAILKIANALISLVICGSLSAQIDSVKLNEADAYMSQADLENVERDTFSFTIDTIKVSGIVYENKIIAHSFFKEMKTELVTTLYLKKDSLVLIHVEEPSPNFGSNIHRFCNYYFENRKLIFQRCAE